jgi:glycosyltransferase involved in cell wall biosynthesis
MPVYNAESVIDEALTSMTSQTFYNFEILTIDDGSTDNSLKKMQLWASRDTRIKVFTQGHEGCHVALNRLIALSTGTYIARMDADDVSHVDRLQEQVNYLDQNHQVDLVSTGYAYFINKRIVYFGSILPDDTEFYRQMIMTGSSNPIPHGSVMFRRSSINGYMPCVYRTKTGQDFDLWLRMLAQGSKFGAVGKVLYFYRKGSQLQNDTRRTAIRSKQMQTLVQMYKSKRLFDNDAVNQEISVLQGLNTKTWSNQWFNNYQRFRQKLILIIVNLASKESNSGCEMNSNEKNARIFKVRYTVIQSIGCLARRVYDIIINIRKTNNVYLCFKKNAALQEQLSFACKRRDPCQSHVFLEAGICPLGPPGLSASARRL